MRIEIIQPEARKRIQELVEHNLIRVVEDQNHFVAEDLVRYSPRKTNKTLNKDHLLRVMRDYFKSDTRVARAWMFGSFARGENQSDSDVDVMIEMRDDKNYTLFDLIDIQYKLEELIDHRVDLAEKDYIKPHAWETIQNDLTTIL